MRVYLFAAVAFAFILVDLVIVIFIIIITVSALLYYTHRSVRLVARLNRCCWCWMTMAIVMSMASSR